MAGYWPQSRSQIHDQNGKPLIGARAFFYAGGTTTPITPYRDYGLTTQHTNPVVADGNGSFPPVYLDEDDAFYRLRVTTAGGVLVYDDDQLPIIGPSGGGGGPPPAPVDPNSVSLTGDIIVRYDTNLRPGFVRLNGRTIGTATSGASERANADCQPLFEHLWNLGADVTGGRGASAAADWAANKPLVLPDFRGRVPVGLDTMGNIAAARLVAATTLGQAGGAEKITLTEAQMPPHAHDITIAEDGEHDHLQRGTGASTGGSSTSAMYSNSLAAPGNQIPTAKAGVHKHNATAAPKGGGGAHDNVQPYMAITLYIRL